VIIRPGRRGTEGREIRSIMDRDGSVCPGPSGRDKRWIF
jgi:hypothetical protein